MEDFLCRQSCIYHLAVPQINNYELMINMIKVLKAFEVALTTLCSQLLTVQQPWFLALSRFTNEYKTFEIKYTGYLGVHLFQGKISQQDVIIKFADKYGIHVHNCLANKKIAPAFVHSERFGRYTTVIMEEVTNYEYLHIYLTKKPTFENHDKKPLNKLFWNWSFVPGDLRSNNILVDSHLNKWK